MRDFEVKGPDGKAYVVSAESEDVLEGALAQLFPPPPPDHAANAVELLRKLVEKEAPAFPEIPPAPDPVDLEPLAREIRRLADKAPPPAPEPVDLQPLIDAMRRVEAKGAPKLDLAPLAKKLVAFGERLTALSSALAQANADNKARHTAVVDALERLHQVMSAPRRLVRENGRPVASVVDLDGDYDEQN